MASFFGFGSKRKEDIPVASSNTSRQQPAAAAAPPSSPPMSPLAPPPTKISFSMSPALTSPASNNATVPADNAAQQLNLPTFSIFSPAATSNEDNASNYDANGSHDQTDPNVPIDADNGADTGVPMEQGEPYHDEDVQGKSPQPVESIPSDEQPPEPVDSYDGAEEQGEQYPYCAQCSQSYETAREEYAPQYSMDHEEQQTDAAVELQQFNDDQPPSDAHEVGENGHFQYHQQSYYSEHNTTGVETVEPSDHSDHHETSPPMREFNEGHNERHHEARTEPVPTITPAFHNTLTYESPSNSREYHQPRPFMTTPSPSAFPLLSLHNRNRTPTPKPMSSSAKKAKLSTPVQDVYDKTRRRRHEFQQNIHNLERRVGSISAKLANVAMDREFYFAQFSKTQVCEPLEEVMERLALERANGSNNSSGNTGRNNSNSAYLPRWMAVSCRLANLDTEVTAHDNVTLPNAIRDEIDSVKDALIHDDAATYYLEKTKLEHRESSLWRQFEAVAGLARRRYHEDRAVRHGAVDALRQKLLTATQEELDPSRVEEAIVKVQHMRMKLEEERHRRHIEDERIKVELQRMWLGTKRAMLEGLVSPDDETDSFALTTLYQHED